MKKYTIFFIVFVLSLVQFVQAQDKLIDRVVATVGSNIILQSDVDMQYTQYLANGGPANPNFKCQALQQLIMTKLLAQQAVIDSVEVSEAEVDDRINQNMRHMIRQAGNQERLEGFLKRSVLQYKEEIRPTMAEQMRAERLQGNIVQKINVTPQEVSRYFDGLNKDSLPYFNTEIETGEIVIEPVLTKSEKEQYKNKAEGYRQQILAGSDFGTIARFYSECPSAPNGGDLGFSTREGYVKEFSAVAFKLKPGEISEVFETPFGFHFLQVLERRGEEVNVRHLLITMKPTQASLERAKSKIDSVYNLVATGKMSFHTAASLYSDAKETKFNGGMVFDQNSYTRSTMISVDGLERDLFAAIDTLKPGQYSKPYLFSHVTDAHRDGIQAYKFNYLKTRVAPHQANMEQDFAKIQEAAQQDKVNRYLSEWFEKRTASTYIHVNEDFSTCDDLELWLRKPKEEEKVAQAN
ncbi:MULTISPECIES: peptidylprolyl isomerase [Sphingobacterium]|uniref:Peptidylprolyl isomerase n=1 Tax=Sphingobacterium populi TaxID=1812824 RepID=A0ABW5UCX3_9SPHI|nr:peptidylprolyl isomerase [Sphingobacterium sp. CFCC 11742]